MSKRIVFIICSIFCVLGFAHAQQERYSLEQIFRMAIADVQTQKNGQYAASASEVLKELGPEIMPFLIQKLDHPFSPGQIKIQSLMTSWKSNAVPYLAQAYASSTNQRTRRAIIYYLGLLKDSRGGPVAEKELNNTRNRPLALWAMGKCGMTQALSYAYTYIHSSNQMDRVRSIGLIRRVGTAKDIPLLTSVLNTDLAWNVRSAAARALYEEGRPACIYLTNTWPTLTTPAKIHTISIISEVTNFCSAEVLKLYTSEQNAYIAAHAARLLKKEDPELFQSLAIKIPENKKWQFGIPQDN